MSRPLDEKLDLVRTHFARAFLEGLLGTRALFEAALQVSGDISEDSTSRAATFMDELNELIAALEKGNGIAWPASLATPLAQAVEREIERWEGISQADPNARPVLRAFLGMRELLFEFGLRAEQDECADTGPVPEPPRSSDRPRVQRFDVEE